MESLFDFFHNRYNAAKIKNFIITNVPFREKEDN